MSRVWRTHLIGARNGAAARFRGSEGWRSRRRQSGRAGRQTCLLRCGEPTHTDRVTPWHFGGLLRIPRVSRFDCVGEPRNTRTTRKACVQERPCSRMVTLIPSFSLRGRGGRQAGGRTRGVPRNRPPYLSWDREGMGRVDPLGRSAVEIGHPHPGPLPAREKGEEGVVGVCSRDRRHPQAAHPKTAAVPAGKAIINDRTTTCQTRFC